MNKKRTELTLNLKTKRPPLQKPSSGHIINLKDSKSSGSGNSVLQVFGKFNSLISGQGSKMRGRSKKNCMKSKIPFCIRSCAAEAFFCVPDFDVCSPSFFCCFNEKSFIIFMRELLRLLRCCFCYNGQVFFLFVLVVKCETSNKKILLIAKRSVMWSSTMA